METVKTYRKRLLFKFNSDNISQAIVQAFLHGYLPTANTVMRDIYLPTKEAPEDPTPDPDPEQGFFKPIDALTKLQHRQQARREIDNARRSAY